MTICNRCLLDDSILGVKLDANGVCNFCKLHDDLEKKYPVSPDDLSETFDRIKKRGKGHDYDCLVGFSGGIDSTYMLYLCKLYGVRVLAFHFDNGFDTEQAKHNMGAILKYTQFPYQNWDIKPETWRRVNIAVLMAGVSDADIPNDIAMAKLMLDKAHEFDCMTILNGHSFRNEGSVPIGWTYMDGAYLKDMYQKYWRSEIHKDFPVLGAWDQVKASLRGIKHERPLYHLGYTKGEQVAQLKKVIDFKEYTGHHGENDYTKFAGWITYHRYGIDKRRIVLSAWIRTGRITKREANIQLSNHPNTRPSDLIDLIIKRLPMYTSEYQKATSLGRKMFYTFRTYQKTFRRWRWLLWIATKLGFFPETFYRKYTQRFTK